MWEGGEGGAPLHLDHVLPGLHPRPYHRAGHHAAAAPGVPGLQQDGTGSKGRYGGGGAREEKL